MKYNHILLTRFDYDDKNEFEKRLEIMKNTLIKSLKAQTNKKFYWGVIGDDFLDDYDLGYKFIKFKTVKESLEFCQKNDINIQTRIDSDDFFSNDFIDFVWSYDLGNSRKQQVLLNFNAKLFDYKAQKLTGEETKYHNGNTSMFLTLIDNFIEYSVYQKKHRKMRELPIQTITINSDYCFYSQHDLQNNHFVRTGNKKEYAKRQLRTTKHLQFFEDKNN